MGMQMRKVIYKESKHKHGVHRVEYKASGGCVDECDMSTDGNHAVGCCC